jgi:nucleotidyltransferase substrate binding protein (TIGR01987 family)
MALELASLKKAVTALSAAIEASRQAEAQPQLSKEFKNTVRAGVIQCFEVAYERCWKFIQRWIAENKDQAEASNPRTRKELFRLAARYGLVDDPAPWFIYGDARNLTSHVYDEEKAAMVYEAAKRFPPDAGKLVARLETSND